MLLRAVLEVSIDLLVQQGIKIHSDMKHTSWPKETSTLHVI